MYYSYVENRWYVYTIKINYRVVPIYMDCCLETDLLVGFTVLIMDLLYSWLQEAACT